MFDLSDKWEGGVTLYQVAWLLHLVAFFLIRLLSWSKQFQDGSLHLLAS